MWITYIRLKNYIGIKNGVGTTQIEINFNLRNKVNLLIGKNGSGKSTIINSLHPFSFGESDKPNIVIEGQSGEKEIHYKHNNIYYKILHIYSPNKNGGHNVKSYISKGLSEEELIELNPNGNVSSFKEIVYQELSIDALYLRLSKLSIGGDNIVKMNYTERKKYFNDIQPTLEVMGNIHKRISEKATELKRLLTRVIALIDKNSDISQLNFQLSSITDEFNSLTTSKEDISVKAKMLITEYNTARTELIKNGIITEDNSIIQNIDGLVNDYNIRLSKELSKYDKLSDKIKSFKSGFNGTDINEASNVLLFKYEGLLKDAHQNIINHDDEIKSLYAVINERNEQLINKQHKVSNMISSSEYKSSLELLDIKTKERNKYDSYIKELNIPEKILSSVNSEDITNIQSVLYNISEVYDIFASGVSDSQLLIDTINDYSSNGSGTNSRKMDIMRNINDYNNKLSYIGNKMIDMKNKIEQSKKMKSLRPSNCNIDNCHFITNYINDVSDDTIIKLEEEKIKYEDEINRLNSELIQLDNITKHSNELRYLINMIYGNMNILNKLPITSYLTDIDSLLESIKNRTLRINWNLENINEVIQSYEIKCRLDKDIEQLERSIENYSIKIDYVNDLENDIKIISSQIDEYREKHLQLHNRRTEYNSEINKYNSMIRDIKVMMSDEYELEYTSQEIDKIKNRINIINKNSSSIINLRDNSDYFKNMIGNINNRLYSIGKEKDDIIYKIKTMEQYQQEKEQLEAEYNRTLILKDISSSTKGIPLIFTEVYMKKARRLANRLLQEVLTDEYELMPFVINEKEFRIPCKKLSGVENKDIITMSEGEKAIISLVLSCALLAQGSTQYNIMILDEMDGPLDVENKTKYLGVLENIMNIFDMEQIFVISHNNAFENYEANMILLKGANINNKKDENILFEVN